MSFTRAVLLAADANGRDIVSIHAKLTYKLLPSGECELSETQVPFLNMAGDDRDDRAPAELDVIPFKAGTDLIVMANAYAPRGRRIARMTASIACGEFSRHFLVHGDRRCIYRGRGSIAFSQPEPFETMPVVYEVAYGGADPHVPVPPPKTLAEGMLPH